MEAESGDEYIRRTASFIRANEQRLANIPILRGRQSKESPSSMLSWFGFGADESNTRPLLLTDDPHHLFYLLMRFEAIGIDVGSLDVRVQNLSRPTSMSYLRMLALKDKSDVLSISSFRSTMTSVSIFSLGGSWFGRREALSIENELKYVYSAFTKLPALRVRACGPRIISELENDPPVDSAIPINVFKNLMILECEDIDPRILLGWDILSSSLRSLSIKRSGMGDISCILVDSVIDDKVRREQSGTKVGRPRLIHRPPSTQSQRSSHHSSVVPSSVPEVVSKELLPEEPLRKELPSYTWSTLGHLCFADNNLTFLPPLPSLPSLVSLDLSLNLLISVPPSLSTLPRLKLLNLAHNMIDSVLGIYQQIPSIVSLNISANRLDSLCGVERLEQLVRIDLRDNKIDDLDEFGRLAVLPTIEQIWVSNNPSTLRIQDWRVRCFDIFAKENREIILDGSGPGIMERRSMLYDVNKPNAKTFNGRPATISRNTANIPQMPSFHVSGGLEPSNVSHTQTPSTKDSLRNKGGNIPSQEDLRLKARRRKHKRIIDLNLGNDDDSSAGSSGNRHVRHISEGALRRKTEFPGLSIAAAAANNDMQTTDQLSSSPLHRSNTINSSESGRRMLQDATAAQTLASAVKSSKRRARLSPSLFEPSFAPMTLSETGGHQGEGLTEAERFRERIEALRTEVGDSWLKVLSQAHLTNPDDHTHHKT